MMEHQREPVVRRCARPIAHVHAVASRKAVVCLHGFTGYPGEMALPATRLYEDGWDVFVPRYPGHGTNGEDFIASRGSQWLGEAERSYVEAASRYEEVSLVGHSMGGIIAVILAQRYAVKRMVLYAPALLILSLPSLRVFLLSLFVKRKAQSWTQDTRYRFFDERDEDDDAFLGAEYWSWIYPKQIVELERLRRKALAVLPTMTTDTLVLTGGNDTSVPQAVGPLIVQKGKGNNEWVHLPNASHLIPYDLDEASRQEAMQKTIVWLNS